MLIKKIQISSASRRFYANWFKDVPMGPPDPILGVSEAYKKSTNPKKVNVGVGAYRTDDGKPFILSCVRKAEEIMMSKNMNHEYLPIGGNAEFCKLAAALAFGEDSPAIKNKTLVSIQVLSGTGGLRMGNEFLSKFWPANKTVYQPTPTWGNHIPCAKFSGLKVERYRYYHPESCGFDQKGCLEDLNKIPEKSIVLFHACAQNPTGVDPTPPQWNELSALIKKKNLFPFFDMAYQGFASGDINRDAYSLRQFVKDGNQVCLAQSFSKNMGLYGERVGGFHIIADNPDVGKKMMSQLKVLVRPMYSNPPQHGARIVVEVLGDKTLKSIWLGEVKLMAERIINVRTKLKDGLIKAGSKKNWDHITKQIGMFCYTGMTKDQVEKIMKDFHIFLTKDGRISMAGVTSKNVEYLAQAMHTVTK